MKTTKKKYTIVIVDDDKNNIELLKEILSDFDYRVITAVDGKDAIKKIRKEMPDLILLDIIMPEMDGITACKQIKKDKKLKHIPIIFLSSINQTESIVQGFKIGAIDYITKPFKSEELVVRINTHLELKGSRDKIESLVKELQEKILHIKQLRGLLPICANCKNIRDSKGYWQKVEKYISKYSEADFTHTLCPDCVKELYPEYIKK